MDFTPQQSCPETLATSASPHPIASRYRAWKTITSSGWSELRPVLAATMTACLLVQIFFLASLASAEEEFGLMDTATPVCENCVKANSVPEFEQTRVAMNNSYGSSGQLVGAIETEYPFVEPTSYDATSYEQGNVIQSDYGQGFEYDQGFNSGTDLVSYDSQYPVQNYGQAISTQSYTQNFGAMEAQQLPVQQTYSSYQAIPTVTQNKSYAQTYQASTGSGQVQPGLAQQKAQQAAQSGVRGHLGGGLGGAKYEGVGWSNHSAQNAINSCCYWGVRPTAQIGVSKGNDGFWYACVLYY